VLTISETSKRDLVRLYGADPARVDVAYPAVDERFKPAPQAEIERVRARYGLNDRYVLHLGTIKPRKNLPRLIHAFSQAPLPSATQLALGGMSTTGARAVAQAVAQNGLLERVRRLTYVPDDDLPALYSGAACVAIVSLYEGFGMPALEALACGAPLVASNRGSLPEIVGDAAILVDPLDVRSIADGLTRAVDQASRGAAGPARAASFTWSAAAQVTRAALERTFRSGADTPPPVLTRSAAS
jgi:glycosyltransferase involved in cell wall biosynthesis